MLHRTFSLGIAGPTLLVSMLLFGLTGAAAVFLYFQQASAAAAVTENVDSRRIAQELENTLQDVIALLRDSNDQLDALHDRIRSLLAEARAFADKDEERTLVTQLERSFEHYQQVWYARPVAPTSALSASLLAARKVLDAETVPICRQLRDFNARQIEESEVRHQQAVRWLAWGVVGVSAIGALGGIFLGHGMARKYRHSIHQISVCVRDAANRLGQELPTVTLTDDGDLRHVHRQLRDLVPEIEQVVQRLQQREREVLRAEQLAGVGQLAAGVAHELRNPLTSIKMLVQANLEEAEARGVPPEDLTIIEQEIRRMERCLQHFLDFARPPRPERRPLDLIVAGERTLALIAGRARKQQVALEFRKPQRPVVVEADGEQIQQLLVNLTLNALDAMPHGGTLQIVLASPIDGRVELHVLDTGPGIAPALLPRLFQPFVSTKETGLGLGLVVSRRIAESHAGDLQADNRREGGACFILCLPVQDLAGDAAAG